SLFLFDIDSPSSYFNTKLHSKHHESQYLLHKLQKKEKKIIKNIKEKLLLVLTILILNIFHFFFLISILHHHISIQNYIQNIMNRNIYFTNCKRKKKKSLKTSKRSFFWSLLS